MSSSRFMHSLLAITLLLLLGVPGVQAATPIFLGEVSEDGRRATGVDATRLYDVLGDEDRAQVQQCVGALSADVVRLIDGSGRFAHFARPVEEWSALPDDVLLMVLSVEGADELIYARDRGEDLSSLLLAVSLQLADPRTGQIVYSDFDVVDGVSDFDKSGRASWVEGYEGADKSKRGAWTVSQVDRPGFYCTMLAALVDRMTRHCLEVFDPAPVEVEVVRMINGKALVNGGRQAGFFTGSRLASADGSIVLSVEQAYPDYCLARIVEGPERIERWTPVRGYRASGTGGGSTLVGVSRIVFSEDVLAHPDLADLARDEADFVAALAGEEKVALYQSLIATRLTKALADTGAFRMTYPVSGLGALNRAKVRMNTTLNLKRRPGDPFFYQSLVVPDQGIVAVVSNPMCGDMPVIDAGMVGGKLMRYARCLCDLHLYDTRSLGILASGYGFGNDGVVVNVRAGGGGMAFDSGKPHLRLLKSALFPEPVPSEDFPGGALHVAANKLAGQYRPVDLIAPIREGDDAEVVSDLDGNQFVVAAGQPVDVCYHMGDLPLHQGAEETTPIYDRAGSGVFTELEDGDWWIEVDEWASGQADPGQIKSARLPLYGRNALRTDAYGLGRARIEGEGDGAAIGDTDASCMLLAGLGAYNDLPIMFPTWLETQLREYQSARFSGDAAFVAGDDFDGSADAVSDQAMTFQIALPKAVANRSELDKTNATMRLDLDMLMALRLLDAEGKEHAPAGLWKKTDSLQLPADRMYGPDGAREMFWNTLEPRFIGFYKSKKMSPVQ